MGGIVRIPHKVKLVPNDNTGNNVTKISDNKHNSRTYGESDESVELLVLEKLKILECSANAKQCKRNNIVKKTTKYADIK